jgi:hypothetical protein
MMRRDRRGELGVAVWAGLPDQHAARYPGWWRPGGGSPEIGDNMKDKSIPCDRTPWYSSFDTKCGEYKSEERCNCKCVNPNCSRVTCSRCTNRVSRPADDVLETLPG